MAKQNKKNKLAKRRLIVFGSISLIAIIYFLTSLFTYTSNIKNLKNQENDLNEELNNLKKDSEILKNEIEKLKDPEYIARYAREEYSYSKQNGEYIIKITDTDEEIKKDEEKKKDLSKYVIFGSVIGLLGIIIYIVKK